MHFHLTIVYTLPAARCVPHWAPGHREDKEVGRSREHMVCVGLLQTGSLLHRYPGSGTYKPTVGWKKICLYLWLEDVKNNALFQEVGFLTCIEFSGHAHRKRCRMPNWTRSSKCRSSGSCDWCRAAVRRCSCSCYSRRGASCQQPTSDPTSPRSRTATAAHTLHPAATGLHTQNTLVIRGLWLSVFFKM